MCALATLGRLMAEPASAASGAALGVVASLFVGMVPDPRLALSWAIMGLIGAILGFGLTPRTGLRSAVFRGIATVAASAVFGALAGEVFNLSKLGTASAIIVTGIFLLQVIDRLSHRVGAIVDAGLSRLGIKVK